MLCAQGADGYWRLEWSAPPKLKHWTETERREATRRYLTRRLRSVTEPRALCTSCACSYEAKGVLTDSQLCAACVAKGAKASLVNEGTRAKRDDEIRCPCVGRWRQASIGLRVEAGPHTIAECLSIPLEESRCPCRELHEQARGMEHVLGLMRARLEADEKPLEEECSKLRRAIRDALAILGNGYGVSRVEAEKAVLVLERALGLAPGGFASGERAT